MKIEPHPPLISVKQESRLKCQGCVRSRIHQVLTVYYDDVIYSLINAMKETFSNSRRMPKLAKPIPIVLSGGTASPKGFRDRFEKILRQSDFPVQISEIRMARDPYSTTARGALVAALTEM
ncbi:MAG: hypothetical protein FJW39_07685 [Acidobacteria bacterium]|nr:hypothetical protein [Acidobacteriota bacterium]